MVENSERIDWLEVWDEFKETIRDMLYYVEARELGCRGILVSGDELARRYQEVEERHRYLSDLLFDLIISSIPEGAEN